MQLISAFDMTIIFQQKKDYIQRNVIDAGYDIKEFNNYLGETVDVESGLSKISLDELETKVQLFKREKLGGIPSGKFKQLLDSLELTNIRSKLHIYPVDLNMKKEHICNLNSVFVLEDSIQKHEHGIFSGVSLKFTLKIGNNGRLITTSDNELKLLIECLALELPFVVTPPIDINHPRMIDNSYLRLVKDKYEKFFNNCLAIKAIRHSQSMHIFLNSTKENIEAALKDQRSELSKQIVVDRTLTKAKSDTLAANWLEDLPWHEKKPIAKVTPAIDGYLKEAEAEFNEIDRILSKLVQISQTIESQYDSIFESYVSLYDLYEKLRLAIKIDMDEDKAHQKAKTLFSNSMALMTEHFKDQGRIKSLQTKV